MDIKFFKKALEEADKLESTKTLQTLNLSEIKESLDLSLEKKTGEDQLEGLIEKIFHYSVNTRSPGFLNQLYGGSQKSSCLGELMVALLNTSMATSEVAPLFTLMEKELLSLINKKIEFDRMEGLMVPGGSYANMYALHCARYKKNPAAKTKGLYGAKRQMVFVSEKSHYSTRKAMSLLGFGEEQMIKVKVDSNKKMNLSDLTAQIQKACDAEDQEPLMVVSTAGTTVWGSFDPILEIQDVAEKFGLWHHVDAAWGGLALWSEDKDQLFKGISKVDSVTIDFHKLMASTLTKAFFITSHPEALYGSSSGGGEAYIFQKEDVMNVGSYHLQCGRKVNSLPLWLQIKLDGEDQFQKKYEELCLLREKAVEFLRCSADRYRLLQEPEFMNICFQVLPKDKSSQTSEYNKVLRQRLLDRGHFMVNFSTDQEHGAFFRLVLSHWSLDQKSLDSFFKELEQIDLEMGG